MKWYYFAAIAIVATWVFRPKKPEVSKWWNIPTPTPEQKVAAEANANWPGGAGDLSKIHQADQTLYPGFYINEFGGYFNPETGESFSPGSSPAVQQLSPYDSGAKQRPVFDTTEVGLAPNAVAGTPGEIIY